MLTGWYMIIRSYRILAPSGKISIECVRTRVDRAY